MATAVAKGNAGVCTTDATRESVSRTEGGAGNTDIRSSGAVVSVTKNLRVPYATQEALACISNVANICCNCGLPTNCTAALPAAL